MHAGRLAALLVLVAALAACTRPRPAPPSAAPAAGTAPSAIESRVAASAAARAVVDAPDRTPADRALDAGRHPAELLSFIDVRPGMRVAEIAAGGGYTTELLARAVGPTGRVWAQNNRFILDRFAAKPLGERLATPAMAHVVRVEREFDDPLPPDARNLDAVVMVLFYHDLFWMGVDRDAMNRRIHDALEPGGVYAVIDHGARPGAGAADVKTLHRVEESLVRTEVERAGFRLVASADFLRNPDDARDWNASPTYAGERRGTSDRFALLFVKPVGGAADERRPWPAVRPAMVESRTISAPVADFLRRPLPATLVTLNPNGSPQASVMWYDLRDGALLFTTTTERVKFRNVGANRRATISILDPRDMYRWVIVSGTLAVDRSVDPARLYRGLAERYLDPAGFATWTRNTSMQNRTVLRLVPKRVRTMGLEAPTAGGS